MRVTPELARLIAGLPALSQAKAPTAKGLAWFGRGYAFLRRKNALGSVAQVVRAHA